MLKLLFIAIFLASAISDTQAASLRDTPKAGRSKRRKPKATRLKSSPLAAPESAVPGYEEEAKKIGDLYAVYNNIPEALIPSLEGITSDQAIEQARINKEFEDARERFMKKHVGNMEAINAYFKALGSSKTN